MRAREESWTRPPPNLQRTPRPHRAQATWSGVSWLPPSLAPHEWIVGSLEPDRGLRAVSRDHQGILGEREQSPSDGSFDRFIIASPEIGPPDTAAKQRIACHQQAFLRK